MLYCIGLGKPEDTYHRYILNCDDHWYEASTFKSFNFTKEDVERIIQQLKKHFQSKVFVLDMNGNIVLDTNTNKNALTEASAVKASGLKLKIRV
jgi:hypothetical protein